MSLYNRINIGLALSIVFLLVFATNRLDKRHFETVQNTVISLHTDRVIAQDLIYKMNLIIYNKQLSLLGESSKNVNHNLNKDFNLLIEKFSETKLTKKESQIFEKLKVDFNKLTDLEAKMLENNEEILTNINIIKSDLIKLSEIQIKESKSLTSIAQKSLDTNNLMSKLEIGFLVLIGLIIQFTIFYRVKKSKTEKLNN
ncbi:hypothetical protein LPB03_04370 [Polaribacter vadi]|uniref:Chemotaxis methyl-accepting receptor HlyB-like 4HB MCP domain-containing protein n=1 Tax=Polaribacter vadi TaxID=1774273 RepID=A0A1B8TXA5_9FLAO|nr:hypothetical protein [Polaribacter vadi]AOW16746.1 hypothetical protein LPB03_04370 [Polaribacter vadi]OBY64346.1 hypothetical protein LPB3_08125 [Polaribacter vadi]